ncbi:MAG: hypothetical protein RLZZ283_580 [Candidatus Parcubacteria bacterium]|jgi:hypothetical protein
MDALVSLLPVTLFGWVVQLAISIPVALVVISFGEYIMHAWFMHRRFLPEWAYTVFPGLARTIYEHRGLHHDTYFKQFNHEPDPVGRHVNMYIKWKTTLSGAILVGALFSFIGVFIGTLVPAIVFFVLMVLHRYAWNTLHPEMHNPRHPWWTKYTAYKYLARYHYLHHYLHHKGIRMNYNIVVPCADFVLGRHAHILDEQNIKEVKEYGYWY